MFQGFFRGLNIKEQCGYYKVSIFACPQFLFIVMGIIIIAAMLITTVLARAYSDDPAVVVMAVSIMAGFLFIIGHAFVAAFQKLAEASRMKSEFVNIVSHQLRSPLSAIKWQLEIMLEKMKDLPQEFQTTMGGLREQNERMIVLVNDLLEVNRIEDDRLILRPVMISLDSFVEQIAKGYEPLAAQAEVRIECEIEARPLWVFADQSKLRWVTENLIDNALRYTLKQGEVTIRIIKDGATGRIEVSDTGVGIPIKEQAQIFTKFFRAENAIRLRTHGTGLGLYLVKSLVEAMSGRVGFASLEGKGSTFWFGLPLIQGASQQSAEQEEKK
ncbi:MAG: HAMP domain-containing sensor histidine kinase [Patescibacteria group bacterium]